MRNAKFFEAVVISINRLKNPPLLLIDVRDEAALNKIHQPE